jgi:RNA polymerase sigma-70 factor (ECF subfamily)
MAATLAKAGVDDATPLHDASLVAALRRGDEAAFVGLVEQYQSSLLRLARLYVSDGAAAEDVVQETWLGLLRGLDRFEGRASLKTWLFRILVNRARTRAVRDARTSPFSTLVELETETVESALDPARFRPADDPRWPGHWLLPPSPDDLPEQRLLCEELTEEVRAAVAGLPPAQREVVTLRDIEGWTAEEVCRLLELSEANQRVLLHRGRSKVRAALESYLARDRATLAVA